MTRKARTSPEVQHGESNKEQTEMRLRKRIIGLARAAGGKIGIAQLASRIRKDVGEAEANAAVSLAFIMQEEGAARLDIGDEYITMELTDDEPSEVDRSEVL